MEFARASTQSVLYATSVQVRSRIIKYCRRCASQLHCSLSTLDIEIDTAARMAGSSTRGD